MKEGGVLGLAAVYTLIRTLPAQKGSRFRSRATILRHRAGVRRGSKLTNLPRPVEKKFTP